MKWKSISGINRLVVKVVVAVFLFVSGSQVMAQSRLRDMVTKKGFDWLIGHWEGVNDKGEKIQIAYTWELNGHIIAIDFTIKMIVSVKRKITIADK